MGKKKEKKTIEYQNANIPTGKDPTEYTYIERRAELLKHIIVAGDSKMINRTQAAARYGKGVPCITKDIQALDRYMASSVSVVRVQSMIITMRRRIGSC